MISNKPMCIHYYYTVLYSWPIKTVHILWFHLLDESHLHLLFWINKKFGSKLEPI